MNIDKFTITSYDQLTGFDRANGSLELILDELSDFSLAQEEEKTDITGRGGRTIGSLKKNKKVTGSGTNGMLSGGAIAAMTGSDVENGEYVIRYTDTITVHSNGGTTTETAIGTAGNEIGTIYVRDTNNAYVSGGKKLVQTGATPAAGEFSYDPAGTEVIAFYDTKVTGKRVTNDADKYSKTLQVFVDVTCEDGCDNVFHGQFIINRADFSGTFNIQGGADPATQSFEFTSLPDLCTGKNQLWDFVLFD